MSLAAAGALALAAALDRLLAEPPTRFHPVAWFGRVVGVVDDALPDARATGVLLVLVFPVGFAGAASGVVVAAGRLAFGATVLAAALVLFVCASHRLLIAVANDVVALADDDLEAARERLRALAGRDASTLSPAQIRSAAVESAAENLADGLLAPLAAFAVAAAVASLTGVTEVVALAVAAGAAAWVKGVNTLDSMLGYHDRHTGWAPARLDDAVMWLPARLAALFIAVAADPHPLCVGGTLRRAGAAAHVPASPNSGWPMATLAAVLDRRLEKPATYTLFPDAALPSTADARRGVRVVSRAGWLGVGATGVLAAI